MIYFAQAIDGGPIKISYSENVIRRISQLEVHYGRPLAILAVTPGDEGKEREIHSRFSHLRFGRTEQFRPTAELMAFIGRPLLVCANPESVEQMPSRHGNSLAVCVDTDLVTMARYICAKKGVPLSELLSDLLRPAVEREFNKLGKELLRDTE